MNSMSIYIFDCFCLFVVIVTVNLYTVRCKKVGVTIKFWNCPWVRYCIALITHFAISTPFPATGRSERKSGFNREQYSAPQSSLCGLLWIIVSELVDYGVVSIGPEVGKQAINRLSWIFLRSTCRHSLKVYYSLQQKLQTYSINSLKQ